MSDEFIVKNVKEWLELPRIDIPSLSSELDDGSTYEVKKVGFVPVDKSECEQHKIAASHIPGGKCALPTAVVKFDGEFELCSLPAELGEWVISCVSMAHAGMNAFPSKVEFGILNGRAYAEML